MANPDFFAESPAEYNANAQLARQIGVASGVPGLRGQYDPEARLNLAFYNKAVKNERKTQLGYHHVFAASILGPDGRAVPGEQLFEDDEKTRPLVVDCDCEEENAVRSANKVASTLARVIRERTQQGIHITPGRPIYEDKIFVKIMIPGEQQNTVDTEAIIVGDPDVPDTHQALRESAHNLKYPRHWEDYKKRQNKKLDGAAMFGTPLRELAREGVFILRPSQVAQFEAAGVRTVEQLLAMPDSVSQHYMGFTTIRKAVREWSEAQAALGPQILQNELLQKYEQRDTAMRAELEELRGMVRMLQPGAQAAAVAAKAAAEQAIANAGLVAQPIVDPLSPLSKRVRHGKPVDGT